MRLVKNTCNDIKNMWNDKHAIYCRDNLNRPYALVKTRATVIWRILMLPVALPLFVIGLTLCCLANLIIFGRFENPRV